MKKRNAPARKGEGVVCQLPGDIDAHITAQLRHQWLASFGLAPTYAAALMPLVWEARP